MYKIEIPATIHQILAAFYKLGMWTKGDRTTIYGRGRKLFYYLYYVIFNISMALGTYQTIDKDERIFLTVANICATVLIHKMWFILWKQNAISEMIHETGTHYTADQQDFVRVDNKLKLFMKCVRYFVLLVIISYSVDVILYPFVKEKSLFFNLAFPLNYYDSEIAFWMAFAFTATALFWVLVCCCFTAILWYLFYSFVLKYELLGNQFRTMGMVRTQEGGSGTKLKLSIAKQQTLYAKDLIVAIQTYDQINGKIDQFASLFSNVFFVQMAVSSLVCHSIKGQIPFFLFEIFIAGFCICGCVYSLAFSSHKELIHDELYCLLLVYCIFDIFMVMYLGNEVKLFSGKLLYCLFESNWMDQTQSCKKSVLVLAERLKQPQEFTVGIIYPLNLDTFTSIVNGAYRLFNILKNFR